MWKYFRFSNIKLSIDLNPFCWGFKWMYQGPTQLDPKLHIQYVRILGLSLAVIIDNGEYNVWEEMINITEPTQKGDPL